MKPSPVTYRLDNNITREWTLSSGIAVPSTPQFYAIPIPRFAGKVEFWLEFKDMFQCLLRGNNSPIDMKQ